MKTIELLNLKENEIAGLKKFKNELLKKDPGSEIIIYGSKARGDDSELSDIDLLILTESEIDRKLRSEISWIKYEIELNYNLIIGMIIEKKDFWKSPLANEMPFHWNVDSEGVYV